MSDLIKSIQNLYKGEISQGEAELATHNLISLFQELNKIYTRLKKEPSKGNK